RAGFDAVYWERFKVALDGIEARVVNANCSVIGVSDPIDLSALVDPSGRLAQAEHTDIRRVLFDGRAVETPIYQRDTLPLDAVIEGPAVIEQMDTTVLIEPGWTARSDTVGNLILEMVA
ncbi:MAG: hydantoinase/oxoprolinase family protein, partial [Pseudomonadota bacterium]